jgi:hypothetical protein
MHALSSNAFIHLFFLDRLLGHRVRRFRFLKQIWELLVTDDWLLEEIFPPEQLKIQPQLPERHPVLAGAAPVPRPMPVIKRDRTITRYGGS